MMKVARVWKKCFEVTEECAALMVEHLHMSLETVQQVFVEIFYIERFVERRFQ
jgi:hypothetical protein